MLVVYCICLPRDATHPLCLDYMSDHCSMAQVNKLVLPLAYKMLDDSRTEMKQKTENFNRTIQKCGELDEIELSYEYENEE